MTQSTRKLTMGSLFDGKLFNPHPLYILAIAKE